MKPLTTFLTLLITTSLLVTSAQADRKSREKEKARQQRLERQLRDVEYILKHESDGTLSDRQAALKNMISTGVAPDAAYWQAGYIKKVDEWVSVQDPWLTSEDEQKVDEYAKARSGYVDSDEGHYKLAQWCAENGYDAQAYAHLKAVLLNHPDHAGLRKLLGYQKIGNRWMNAEEYEAAVQEADRLTQELREWGPEVARISEGLNSADLRQQNRAKANLREITDVAAIPAMELILLPSSDVAAGACVDQLCEIDHRRSSVVLCKAAMFLPESANETKEAAIEELKTRPLEDFVPVLLGKMQTPLTANLSLFTRSGSQFSYGPFNSPRAYLQHRIRLFAEARVSNESIDELRTVSLKLLLMDMHIHRHEAGGAHWQSLTGNVMGLAKSNTPDTLNNPYRLQDKMELINRNANGFLIRTNRILLQQNDHISQANDSLAELLGLINDVSIHESPEYWWAWWRNRIEVEPERRHVENVIEIDESETIHIILASCFTAGTPVWTDRGPRPIEQLHVGDMALTKDVETGELAYRPIIRTTTREPKPLVTINLGPEQITSTGGHPFFVPGEGWVRARELTAGQFLHTPTGTIQIDSVTETPDEETYNLVVDGFHTYFVGMSQALVHDVSITSPTDAIVPGLLDR
jgi:hypothetical protein